MTRIVIATTNKGKLKEFRELLKDHNMDILSLDQMTPVTPCIEDGATFLENAIKKATYYAREYNLPCISEDSGLEVEALGGRPGVFSARFAGEKATDMENNQKLLSELRDETNRKARFVCVLCVALPRGEYRAFEGMVEGEIALVPKGQNGFGYDPVFYYPPFGKTFAELSVEEKNRVSHRARAFEAFKKELPSILEWLNSS